MLPSRTVTARSEVPTTFRSSATRPGPLSLIRIGVTETLARRRLIAYLVRADMKKTGADTLLGNFWWVIDPLLQMLIYYVLIGLILHRGGVDFPLFIVSGILPWKWFDATIKDGIHSVTGQERLIKQIYFPKLVLPVAGAMSGVVSFLFGLIPLFGLMIIAYPSHLSAYVLLIPVIAAVQFLFALSLAIGLGAINVFYRDIGNLSRHAIRFWFYLSPALYGVEEVAKLGSQHALAKTWFEINPWTYLFAAYHAVIFDAKAPEFGSLAVMAAVSIVLIGLAILLFKRLEPTFAKVL